MGIRTPSPFLVPTGLEMGQHSKQMRVYIWRQWRNFVPAGFRRHLVGKPLKNAGYCNSA